MTNKNDGTAAGGQLSVDIPRHKQSWYLLTCMETVWPENDELLCKYMVRNGVLVARTMLYI